MDKQNKKIRIILTGGGTAGSVAPLLGVVDEFKKEGYKFDYLWLGTKTGPERSMVEAEGIEFRTVMSGKLRRYFSLLNFIDPIRILIGTWQAYFTILDYKPTMVLSAGSYVSVPVAWAAKLRGVPVLVHQQDARAGLANKLMAPAATIITVALEESLSDYGQKAKLVGNSVREEIREVKVSAREARQKLGLSTRLPIVLIMGGGTGAQAINDLVEIAAGELTRFCQVLHITGKGKLTDRHKRIQESNPNYRAFEFLDAFGMIKVFSAADVVVSRAGMSTLTELSFLGKAAIIIPIPNSHQEENAQVFKEEEAALVLRQQSLGPKELTESIRMILLDENLRQKLKSNIQAVIKPGGTERIAAIILEYLNL